MPSKEEIEDKFDTIHTYNLISLLTDIKNSLKGNAIPILNNESTDHSEQFINLIKYNIDYKDFYNNK